MGQFCPRFAFGQHALIRYWAMVSIISFSKHWISALIFRLRKNILRPDKTESISSERVIELNDPLRNSCPSNAEARTYCSPSNKCSKLTSKGRKGFAVSKALEIYTTLWKPGFSNACNLAKEILPMKLTSQKTPQQAVLFRSLDSKQAPAVLFLRIIPDCPVLLSIKLEVW